VCLEESRLKKLFIYQLVEEYKARFGFKRVLIRNIKINKWIILYLLVSLLFPIVIVGFFYNKELFFMILSTVLYIVILYVGGEQHKHRMINTKPANILSYDIIPFREMLGEKFGIINNDQLIRLDEVIKREIALVSSKQKQPFADVIRQLFVALLTTGLLSYAFLEIRNGNAETGKNLVAIYLIVIAVLLVTGGILKQIKDFGSTSYLNEISFLIQLSLLEISLNQSLIEVAVSTSDSNITVLPSRKNRRL
jgi:hypothetical protein